MSNTAGSPQKIEKELTGDQTDFPPNEGEDLIHNPLEHSPQQGQANVINIDRTIINEACFNEETNIIGGKIESMSSAAENLSIARTTIGDLTVAAEQVNLTGVAIENLSNVGQDAPPLVVDDAVIGEVVVAGEQANFLGANIGVLNYIAGNQLPHDSDNAGAESRLNLTDKPSFRIAENNSGGATHSIEQEPVFCGKKTRMKSLRSRIFKAKNIKRFMRVASDEAKEICRKYKVTEDYSDLHEPDEEYSIKKNIINDFFRGGRMLVQNQYMVDESFEINRKSSEHEECRNLVETVLNTPNGYRTSVIGPAGSGKTTSIKRFVRNICQSEECPELIHFLSFRDIPITSRTTPCDLLFGHLPVDNPDDLALGYQWLLKNQSKAIFVFDGLDQATWTVHNDAKVMRPYDECNTSVIMSNILNKKLFPEVRIVYTSREHSVADLSHTLRPDLVIGLAGLSESDIKRLFKSFVGNRSEELWEILITESHSLLPLLSIPAFLIFTAVVYKSNPDNPPKFVTGVMLELLDIFKRSGHITEQDISTVMKGLEKMSFDGMINRTVLFIEKNIESVGLLLEQIRDWVVTVPGTRKLNQRLLRGDRVMYFFHQTIQEILSSRHISTLELAAFRKIVQEQLVKEHWSVVTRFLSGILLNNDSSIDKSEVRDIEEKRGLLRDMLTSKYKNAKNVTEKLSALTAISESNDKHFIQGLVEEIDIESQPLSPTAMHVISSVIRHCTTLKTLRLHKCNLDCTSGSILWNDIKDRQIKVQHLDFSQNDVSGDYLSSIGRIIDNNGRVCLVGCTIATSGWNGLKAELGDKKLEVLNLSYNCNVDLSLGVIGSLMTDGSSLNLNFSKVTQPGLQRLKSGLEDKKVKELNLACSILSDISLRFVGSIIGNNGILNLRCCDLNKTGLESLKGTLGNKKLKELDLASNKNIDQSLHVVADIIATGASLNLDDCNITASGLKSLLNSLTTISVKELNLASNNLSDQSLSAVGCIIENNGILNLRSCNITKFGLESLKGTLGNNKLKELDLTYNKNINQSLHVVADIMAPGATLNLHDCSITVFGLESLQKGLKTKSISKLNISFNDMNTVMVSIVAEIVQNCDVERLKMEGCHLTQELLDQFLSETRGSKLSCININANPLPLDAIERAKQTINLE